MLKDPDALDTAIGMIKPGQFYKEAHNKIFRAMIDLSNAGEPVDTITLSSHLSKTGDLERVGGAFYLTGLWDEILSVTSQEHYCQIVVDRANERATLAALHEASEGIYANRMTAEEAQSKVFELADDLDTRGFSSLESYLPATMERIETIFNEGMMPGISTGHVDLDKIMGGFAPGHLVIVAGRPSMGKTAFAMGVTEFVASKGHPAAIVSIESTAIELVMRSLMQARSDSDTSRPHEGIITKDALEAAYKKVERLKEYPIWFDDSGLQHIDQIRARARRLKSQYGIEILMVDYLQLLSGGTKENRRLEIREYTQKLKMMAKDLQITVMCLSQLSRAPELRSKTEKRPIMSDLRETGDIEQDADEILFLYRPEYYGILKEVKGVYKDRDNENLCEVRLAKHRDGPTGTIELTWIKKKVQFFDRAQYLTVEDMPGYSEHQQKESQPPPDDDAPF